jgi:RsiW-degrading membrane proteinase PrsW (M82 family)
VQGFVDVSAREVLLLDKITGSEILKSPVFRFLCLFALTPLAILVLGSNDRILYALAIWSGVFWALLLFRLFADRSLQFRWAVGMVLFTAFVMLPIFEIYLALPPHLTERLIEMRFLPARFVGFVCGVGVREELCKAVPLVALALFSTRMKHPLNGLVLGMMSGIGFAISENVYYVHRVQDLVLTGFLKQLKQTGKLDPVDFESFVIPVYNNVIRMMTGPFGHGVYSGIFGYFISLAAANRSRRFAFFVAGLGLSSFIHGLYDTVESPLLGVFVKAFGFFLLMTYILKARGATSARELAGGMFSRTVIGRAPQESELAALRAAAVAPPVLPSSLPIAPSAAGTTIMPLPVSPAYVTLRAIQGPASGRSFELVDDLRLGRDAELCQVHLAETMVSRQHAVVCRVDGSFRIRRLSTTGPVYVNGQATEDAPLRAGDQLQIGNSVFRVE